MPEGRHSRNTQQPIVDRCCLRHSPALRPWIAARAEAAGVLRGGALEPESRICHKKGRLAPTAHNSVNGRAESLSLLGGASVWISAFQAEHHLGRFVVIASGNTEGDHLVALVPSRYAALLLAAAPREGVHGVNSPCLRCVQQRAAGGQLGTQRVDVGEFPHSRTSASEHRAATRDVQVNLCQLAHR